MSTKEQLIQKLFANQCSKEELNLLFELIQKDETETGPQVMMTLLQQLDEVPTLNADISERIGGKVWKETIEKESTSKDQGFRPQSKRRFLWIRSAAAAVILLVVTSWFVFQNPSPSEVIVQTTFGEQQSIELPDGSHIKLNANSTLSYNKEWNDQDSRKVWLQGEAFFEVVKKEEARQKFQVITKDLTVEVLGTVFNVNSHQKETKVFLEEGKIQLNLNGLKETMLMEPGELVAYSETKKEQPAKRQVLPKVHTSWKDGLMLFDETPLKEVLEKVEEVYGVNIQVSDTSHYARELTTGIPIENLKDALSILEATMGIKIIKEKDRFIIQ